VSTAAPPHRVRLPVNVHHWDHISFLHWPVDPDEIQPRLPAGLRVDLHDGAAWLGVTPFFIRVRPLGLPVVLPGWSFPETNVRTYVVGPDGRRGIWFLRMEVTAWWFVVALRALGLPYVRQRMAVDATADTVRYRSSPLEAGGAGGHDITVRPGASLVPATGGPLEQFLTARWNAYHRVGRRLLRTTVEHPPWELRTAEVERCDIGAMFDAVGVSSPTQPPLVHISPGVVVRLAAPAVLR
jgi:uncharacterized protein